MFARGFPGTASLEFYAWLDSEWTKAVAESNDNSELMECSPIMFCKFGAIESAEFLPVPWNVSQRGGNYGCDGFWCRVLDSRSHGKSQLGEAHFEALERGEYGRIHAAETGKLQELMEKLMLDSNSFSFPTIQMKIDSPMMGLVPFDVRPVRLKIGGEIAAGDREK